MRRSRTRKHEKYNKWGWWEEADK